MLWGSTLALPCRALGRQCCYLRAASAGAEGQAASASPGRVDSLSGQQHHLQLGKAPAMKVTFTLAWFLTTASSSGADPVKANQGAQAGTHTADLTICIELQAEQLPVLVVLSIKHVSYTILKISTDWNDNPFVPPSQCMNVSVLR